MNENNGSNSKGKDLQESSFNTVGNDKLFELKLNGKSDRAVAKELGISHSTVNKRYNQLLQEQAQHSKKNLENLRFQQYLRFEQVIAISLEELSQRNFRATAWATIVTRQLAEQSKLYGLNTGDVNINLDQREGTFVSDVDTEDMRKILRHIWINHVEGVVKGIMCQLLLGEEYGHLPHQEEYLKEIIGDIYEEYRRR